VLKKNSFNCSEGKRRRKVIRVLRAQQNGTVQGDR